MDQAHEVDFRLPHHVGVSEAANYLLGALACDQWEVACQQEHMLLVRLTQAGRHKYAVRFECTTPIEKGIYHSRKAWVLSLLPLGSHQTLVPDQIARIRAGLAKLE